MSLILNGLINWANSIVPECADESVLPSSSSTQLSKKDIFNEASSEFVKLTKCFPREKKFTCTASNYTYPISSNVPDFFQMREEGIWHYRSDTSTTTWDRVVPTTVRELDQELPAWRTQSNNDYVRKYWQDGDTLGFFYTPSTTITNGFWIYYYGLSSDMSSLTHYPFTGTTTEDPRLTPYEKVLLPYYEYRALGILGYKADSIAKEQEFYLMCDKAKVELHTRRDLAQSSKVTPKSYVSQYKNTFRR